MIALLSLLPCAVVVVAIMVLRVSGVTAAALALAAALLLWAFGVFSPASFEHLLNAISDALVLELLVGFVIFFGLLFVEVSSRGGGLKALDGAIRMMNLSPPRAVILVTLGLGVMLESLTGYGVSMLVTVPLLLQLVGRTNTIWLALIGMSLMSWGALSVAALLGSELAGISTAVLADSLITTSGPVAAVLPICCLLVIQKLKPGDLLYALLAGCLLVTGIGLSSHWIGVEVAGVGGGLAVILLSLLVASPGKELIRALRSPALFPYHFLIIAVVLQKTLATRLSTLNIAPTIETSRVSFQILQSPGIALLAVALLCISLRPDQVKSETGQALLCHVVKRSWRALISVFLFLVTARLLIEVGAIAALSSLLAELGAVLAILLVTTLGGFGAYVTGSGIASNALFMPSAAAAGDAFDLLPLFAALQHSGASHFALASLPVIAILLAALPDRQPADDRLAMRAALVLATVWTSFVVVSGWTQWAMST